MKHGFIITPRMKRQSKQWPEEGGSAPRKAKTVPSVEKMIVFWHFHNVVPIHCLEKEKSSMESMQHYWINWIDAIKTKHPHLAKKKCCFVMTMHPLTLLQLQSQNYMNCDIRIGSARTVFTRFSQWLFLLSKHKEMTP